MADEIESDLQDPALYINRELSWLEFNQRVLDEAHDEANPLLERVRFLSIVSSNLDEFFEIRVAGLQQQVQSQSSVVGQDRMKAAEQLDAISKRVRKMVGDQYRCWREELLPALERENIRFLTYPGVEGPAQTYLENYFADEVYPVLTPLAIDPGHPFPQLLNKSLNVAAELDGSDLSSNFAIVQVPRILPRVVALPGRTRAQDFVFIGNLIQHHANALFHGVTMRGAHQFRITRNSDLYIDEDEGSNLLRTIEAELRKMNRGKAVRLEVQKDCAPHIVERLQKVFHLEASDTYHVDGPINFVRLASVIDDIDRPSLKFPPLVPRLPAALVEVDFFQQLKKGDILLHHPYDSFQPVVDFIDQAARDPRVLAIKQTLYRTSGNSPFIPALMEAAQSGKQVTAIVELKARFDEAANIRWARMLQEAGVHVVYGIVGMKTHCKMALVVRREPEGIRKYVHLGTGNYHSSTARVYTDYGLFSARPVLGDDAAELFNLLTGVAKFPGMKSLLVAPFTLHDEMLRLVEQEIAQAEKGQPASLFAKMNSLVDPEMVEALYRASQAGVKIRLLVRGICVLRPGVPGVSENIEVRSIVGRFLEHSRVYRFENKSDPIIYLASADWMPRNFFRRVEACFPIDDPLLKAEIDQGIETLWNDRSKARRLQKTGKYRALTGGSEGGSAQEMFLRRSEERAKAEQKAVLAEAPKPPAATGR